jgi:hypothetical protein
VSKERTTRNKDLILLCMSQPVSSDWKSSIPPITPLQMIPEMRQRNYSHCITKKMKGSFYQFFTSTSNIFAKFEKIKSFVYQSTLACSRFKFVFTTHFQILREHDEDLEHHHAPKQGSYLTLEMIQPFQHIGKKERRRKGRGDEGKRRTG